MNILGYIGWADHDPAAAIIKTGLDGSFQWATIAEERLNRVKYSYHFPLRSIAYCMDVLGIESLDEIDLVVNDWSQHPDRVATNQSFRRLEFDYLKRNLKIPPSKIKIIPSHHLAHAYSTYIPSGFEEAAILIVDALGSGLQGTSLFHAKGTSIEFLESSGTFTLGKLYDAVTRKILNFKVGEDGKTMGLAAFGNPRGERERILKIDGAYNGLEIDYSRFMRRIPDNRLAHDYQVCPDKSRLYDPYYTQVAYEVQDEIEKAMLHLARYAREKTGATNLCIAGGVGLNCVANHKILESGLFEDVFIFPGAADSGVPFGLALYGYYHFGPGDRNYRPRMNHAYGGRRYEDREIIEFLNQYSIPFRDTSYSEVAGLIADRKVVGWHTGGSEIGPRALGHRSILADPRSVEMKEVMNAKVKHRELYRPFAPSVLAERAEEYFELHGHESPFMLLAPMIHESKREEIAATVHVDGSGRVQTVSRENSPEYHELIKAFEERTGVPVVLNTSFNDNDEPIVETPMDSMLCFLRTQIDYLVYNSRIIIEKEKIQDLDKLIERIDRDRRRALEDQYRDLLRRFLRRYSVSEARRRLETETRMAEHYKFYGPLEKLHIFLLKHRKVFFIGDEYHWLLACELARDSLEPVDLQLVEILDDTFDQRKRAEALLSEIPDREAVVLGFYNSSLHFQELLGDSDRYCVIYEEFQVHLENTVGEILKEDFIDLNDLEHFSREYNMDTNFDKLFLGPDKHQEVYGVR